MGCGDVSTFRSPSSTATRTPLVCTKLTEYHALESHNAVSMKLAASPPHFTVLRIRGWGFMMAMPPMLPRLSRTPGTPRP